MEPIIIGNKKYYIHPKYISFGVDKEGNVIDIVTRNSIDYNREEMTIRLRKLVGKSKKLKIAQYVWEAINGEKPKNMTIMHINGDEKDNRINNLKLRIGRKKRRYFSDEETNAHNKMKNDIWRNKEWSCPKCGKTMKNNSSQYHKRVCPFNDNPFTEEEKQKNKINKAIWRNKSFICQICNCEYKNGYKYMHSKICHRQEE